MNNHTSVIYLQDYQTNPTPQCKDWSSYEQRAVRRFRRASICSLLITAAEIATTLALGLCLLIATGTFLMML